MGNYLLFAGDHYQPDSMKNNFVGRFTTLEAAEAEAATLNAQDWVTIMDLSDNSFREYYFRQKELKQWPR